MKLQPKRSSLLFNLIISLCSYTLVVYNTQMRVQPRGTEIHFITLTHMLITIYSFYFSCLKLHTEEARVFTSSLSDCIYGPTSQYIVSTYALSAQLLLKRMTSGISQFLCKFEISNEKRRFLLVENVKFLIGRKSQF
jgi:hypothetical protein